MQVTPVSPQLRAWIELTRVQKFAGTMVLFWPYAWSLTMHAHPLRGQRYLTLLALGFIGASLLHSPSFHIRTEALKYIYQYLAAHRIEGAGCIWNDILDREIDRKVERTKHRPLADRRISVPGALVFLAIHLALLITLVWGTTPVVWRSSLIAIFVLPGIYPLMKRVTYWPQAWLGLAMNAGVPVASLLVRDSITPSSVALAAAAWTWTIYYDTVYACQDKRDDAQAGVKSTALLFDRHTKPILSAFGFSFIFLLTLSGIYAHSSLLFYFISIAGGGTFLFNELYRTNLEDPKSCWKTFDRNAFYVGSIIWVGTLSEVVASKVVF